MALGAKTPFLENGKSSVSVMFNDISGFGPVMNPITGQIEKGAGPVGASQSYQHDGYSGPSVVPPGMPKLF